MTARRAYLDWNATAPLRPEAREAMLAAMDAAGNPSSVHAEGRAAKAILEKARAQVAALIGCEPGEVVFTSGATEAAGIAFDEYTSGVIFLSAVEHDCIWFDGAPEVFPVDENGMLVFGPEAVREWARRMVNGDVAVLPFANSETGITNPVRQHAEALRERIYELGKHEVRLLVDMTQALGKARFSFGEIGADLAIASAHKLGGPKGVGVLVVRDGIRRYGTQRGGGQELGRRSGTENVIGIAGFGAAAEAALRDLENGAWARVENLRNIIESRLADAAPDLHVIGKDAPRLPNTSCFAVRGWKGETQVMQMDLAGFAVSAGSACSSGKVGPSRVLMAMGHDEEMAASAIRVSLGPTTTEAEVRAFADTWGEHYRRRQSRAA